MDATAGQPSGGRPLRRRRRKDVHLRRARLRGTAALQVATDQRCHQPMPIAGQPIIYPLGVAMRLLSLGRIAHVRTHLDRDSSSDSYSP
jgi:hypothetical protein